MSTVIRLDASGLSKLIEILGNDFVLELGNAVIKEASKKYIKGIFDPKISELQRVALENEFKSLIGEVINTKHGTFGSKTTVALNSRLLEEVKDNAKKMFNDEYVEIKKDLLKTIDEYLKNLTIDIKNTLDVKISKQTELFIAFQIEKRLNEISKKLSQG